MQREFSTWIRSRVKKYGFEETKDFSTILSKSLYGRPAKDYGLTFDMAKEFCMVENNKKGRQARQYFIAIEKKAKALLKPKSTLYILKLTVQSLEEQKKELNEVKHQVQLLEAKQITSPECYTIVGYATLQKMKMPLKLESSLGRKASKLCKNSGIIPDELPDPRFGRVKNYPVGVLEKVFNLSIV